MTTTYLPSLGDHADCLCRLQQLAAEHPRNAGPLEREHERLAAITRFKDMGACVAALDDLAGTVRPEALALELQRIAGALRWIAKQDPALVDQRTGRRRVATMRR